MRYDVHVKGEASEEDLDYLGAKLEEAIEQIGTKNVSGEITFGTRTVPAPNVHELRTQLVGGEKP